MGPMLETEFPEYFKEMRSFEKSKVFNVKYKEFIHVLWGHTEESPIISRRLEKAMILKGSEIRELVKYGRRNGQPIVTNGKGYFMTSNPEKLMKQAEHLLERARSLIFTHHRMKHFAEKLAQDVDGQTKLAI